MNKETNYHLKYPHRRIIVTTAIVFIITMALVVAFLFSLQDSWHRAESSELKDNYISFQDELEELMQTGVKLLTGFEAYLIISDDLVNRDYEDFLYYLTINDMKYIRNIAIIEDTTIVYNYPIEGNEASIGVDLGQIDGQKEYINKTKNELVRVFQGPVNLVQGGQGYISRVPITDENGDYWGQASIVLKADVINAEILELAENDGLKIAIYNDRARSTLIVGDETVLSEQPELFVSENVNNWAIYVSPIEGWNDYMYRTILILALGALVCFLISFIVYYFQKAHYDLREITAYDQLTSLYNRNYLETVQQQVTKDTGLKGGQYGLMHLDLDNFKSINDRFGHHKGDFVLQSVGCVLKKVIRAEDMAFRIGGDEFLVLVPFVQSRDELEYMKIRLHHDFENNFETNPLLRTVSISIGAALYPEDGENFDRVLKVADIKMYNEKAQHKKIESED